MTTEARAALITQKFRFVEESNPSVADVIPDASAIEVEGSFAHQNQARQINQRIFTLLSDPKASFFEIEIEGRHIFSFDRGLPVIIPPLSLGLSGDRTYRLIGFDPKENTTLLKLWGTV
jgi:hypothetical protein